MISDSEVLGQRNDSWADIDQRLLQTSSLRSSLDDEPGCAIGSKMNSVHEYYVLCANYKSTASLRMAHLLMLLVPKTVNFAHTFRSPTISEAL